MRSAPGDLDGEGSSLAEHGSDLGLAAVSFGDVVPVALERLQRSDGLRVGVDARLLAQGVQLEELDRLLRDVEDAAYLQLELEGLGVVRRGQEQELVRVEVEQIQMLLAVSESSARSEAEAFSSWQYKPPVPAPIGDDIAKGEGSAKGGDAWWWRGAGSRGYSRCVGR